MKIYIQIIGCIFLLSCSNKADNRENLINDSATENNMENSDSSSYELWYAALNIIPESEIIQIEEVNKEERILNTKTKVFRDSLLEVVDINNLSQFDDSPDLLKGALTNSNLEIYCRVVHKGLLQAELYPYSLYMAEESNFIPAYDDVFSYFYKLNYVFQRKEGIRDKFKYSLNALSEDQRSLALYCLIKSYKMGCIQNARVLSYYFREGLYFPKDVATANKLDSIYEYRPPVLKE